MSKPIVIQQDPRTGMVDIYVHGAHTGEAIAPAVLEAAPDMLEALRMLADMEAWRDLDDPEFAEQRAKLFDLVRAAIAKAEGK
jgi:hypothetical protein